MSKRVAVIGGGIAGLALAQRLSQLGAPCTLFEGSSRLGGTIETETRDGFVLEKGPDSFISEKPYATDLAKRLGFESEIIGTRPDGRKSFIVRRGRLIPVPEGFYLISPTKLWPFAFSPLFSITGKLRMAMEPLMPPRRQGGDESVGSFIRRRFGAEALERAGQPMLAGIYTGDPDSLSIDATMPRFRELERDHGSVLLGLLKKKQVKTASGPRYSLFLSFNKGMQTLTDSIAARLPGGSVRFNTPVRGLSSSGGAWELKLGGPAQRFDAVCLTLPAWQSAHILSAALPELASQLEQIPYESVATLNFAFRREQVRHKLDGFGFVVPRTERLSTVACTFVDRKFPGRAPEGFTLLRAFAGGAFGREVFELPDAELCARVLADLRALLGISGEPAFTALKRYPRSMVQYTVGHAQRIAVIDNETQKNRGLYLTGSAFRGVGIPDCIRDAEALAERIVRD